MPPQGNGLVTIPSSGAGCDLIPAEIMGFPEFGEAEPRQARGMEFEHTGAF